MMKSLFTIVAFLISFFAFLQGCTYDKEILLPVPTCTDTVNISFAASIEPLLRANCSSCHSNGSRLGNVSLETYDDVKALAVSGHLLGTISHAAGFVPMPLGADKLDDCSTNAVKIWIDEGTRNN